MHQVIVKSKFRTPDREKHIQQIDEWCKVHCRGEHQVDVRLDFKTIPMSVRLVISFSDRSDALLYKLSYKDPLD